MEKETKNVIIFASLAAIVYLLYTQNKNKRQRPTKPTPPTSEQTQDLSAATTYCNSRLKSERILTPTLTQEQEGEFLSQCIDCYFDAECYKAMMEQQIEVPVPEVMGSGNTMPSPSSPIVDIGIPHRGGTGTTITPNLHIDDIRVFDTYLESGGRGTGIVAPTRTTINRRDNALRIR